MNTTLNFTRIFPGIELPSRKMRPITTFIAWGIAAAAVLNAWSFSSAVATPLIQADAWYFLEHFVAHWLDGHLTLRDFFIQRGATDHIQPIQKLVLLFHTKYFGMDFRIEGLIGVLFGIFFCLVISSQLATSADEGWRSTLTPFFTATVFAVGLSINSTGIYTWPLATLQFSDLLFATLQMIAFLRWGSTQRLTVLAALSVATFMIGLVIDKIAILALAASVVAAFVGAGWNFKRCIKPFTAAAIATLASRFALSLLSGGGAVSESAISSSGFCRFIIELVKPDVWKFFALPLVNSVVVQEHIKSWQPNGAEALTFGIAVLMMALHAWFWWTTILRRIRNQATPQVGVAVALMLLSYALLLGIAYSRVPQFGWDYLSQPRYVAMYQLSCLAMIVLAHAQWIANDAHRKGHAWRLLQIGVAIAYILIQIPNSVTSWGLVPYISTYWSKASIFLGDAATDPSVQPKQCPDIFVFCGYSPQHREYVLNLLRSHQLNIFSPQFQLRNRLYPSITDIPAPKHDAQ